MPRKYFFSRKDGELQKIATTLTPLAGKKKLAVAVLPKDSKNTSELQSLQERDFKNRQLDLFQSVLGNTEEERAQLSNAIDLWDSVPRYSVSRQAMTKARINEAFLPRHEATFQHRGRTYTRIISPARIVDHDGIERDYYPSATEELVEDALRKLAIEQQAGYFDKPNYRSGVVFTLHVLRDELKKRGHARSYQQLVEALNVLSHCIIEIIPHTEGEAKLTAPYLPSLAAVSRSQLNKDPNARWAVQFHPLVTGSIDKVTYRQFNYHLMMSHRTQLARWLHKQLVLKYTFADHLKPFEMRHSTISRDSGLLVGYSRCRDAIDALEAAFDELKARSVLHSCDRKDETGKRRKLIDVVFTLYPSFEFVRETKAANKRQGDGQRVIQSNEGR
jgi:hypothetical protein